MKKQSDSTRIQKNTVSLKRLKMFHEKSLFFFSILVLFYLFCTINIFAEEEEIKLPEDPKKTWTVGITEFSGSNISDENQYLLSSLPALLKEQISTIPVHVLSKEEIRTYQKWIVYNEINTVIGELNTLQAKQNEELFLNKKEFEREKIIKSFEEKRKILREKITHFREIDSTEIRIPEIKDLTQKENSGRLLSAPPYSPLQYAVKNDIDILITGSVDEIQGYLYLEIQVFHRILEKSIFIYRDAGTREELAGFIQEATPEIITQILGREWAGLFIDVDPAFCYIKIEEELVGMGTVEQRFIEPGEKTVEIIAPGYKSIKKNVNLTAREVQRLEIRLEKTESQAILLETLPPGADIYMNSLWIGKTPLIIDRPDILSRLLFVTPGFNSTAFRIGPETQGNVLVSLISLKVDWKSIKESKRDRFFGAMAGFVLSLPVPIFSFGIARDAWVADRMGDYELYSSVYYWSFFLSGALMANMFYELYRYVRSADRPAG